MARGRHRDRDSRARIVRIVLACIAAVIVLVCVYMAGFYSRASSSWGRFGGNCFEVVETGEPGCLPSYKDDTTLTLRVD